MARKQEPPEASDQWLRDWGFEIAARPEGKPALWRYGKFAKPVTVEEAVKMVQKMVENLGKKHHG